jgi:2,4-dienoyl-CoA reductase-like NADH-dependent reductase (Old Yellow Enzyme family)
MSTQRSGTMVDPCPSLDTVNPDVLQQFPNLFKPLSIGSLHIRNRVFVSAHTTMLAENAGPGEGLIAFLEAKARGGVGLIITEAVNAHPSASESKEELCSWEPAFAEGLQKLRERLELYGTVLFVQLFHSGGGGTHAGMMEKAPNIQPSNVPFLCEGLIGTSHAMDVVEVETLIEGYAEAALICKDNGAQGLEVAAAHGYLIHRFLTPLHNQRTDRFGGNFDKRLNFLREILVAIRKKVGADFPVGVRIGCDDFLRESLSHDDMINICKTLDQEQLVDFLDITGSHEFIQRSLINHYGVMDDKAGHMVSKAGNIQRAVSVPVLHAGRIINPRQAEDILAQGHVDMVGMTRASIADPDVIKKTAEQREADIIYCVGCGQACMGRVNQNRHVTCIQNPFTGREHAWGELPHAAKKKRIVVVGGGPAGMTFAWTAASRGHQVSLYDKHHELGGQVLLAEQLPGAGLGGAKPFAAGLSGRRRYPSQYTCDL